MLSARATASPISLRPRWATGSSSPGYTYSTQFACPSQEAHGATSQRRAGATLPLKQGASVSFAPRQGREIQLVSAEGHLVKAVSVGGVALAARTGPRDEVCLAWVGKDGGVGQVFVTQLSQSGDKQTQTDDHPFEKRAAPT